jgi:HD-like signal output (HDOD) protein
VGLCSAHAREPSATVLAKVGIEHLTAQAEITWYMVRALTSTRIAPLCRPADATPEMNLETDSVTIPVKLCDLPPFHAIANQVMVLTADPDIDLKPLSMVIQSDPAFSADILFLANSSLFGFPSRMSSLRHAIALLGLNRIKALAVTVAMRGFLGNGNGMVHQCWRHSLACAIVCEELAPVFDLSPEQAFTAGIMHDIGRLGLLKSYPIEMAGILTREFAQVADVLAAEREVFQIDHSEAGSWLVGNWTLPREFQSFCGHHHDPANGRDSLLLKVVKAACAIAASMGFQAAKVLQGPSFGEATATLRVGPGCKLPPSEEVLRTDITARLAAFLQ